MIQSALSFVRPTAVSPWGTYLAQVERVTPYLGPLAKRAETLKRPKRALIVDVPIEMDDGTVQHFEGYRVQHNLSRARESDGALGLDDRQDGGCEPCRTVVPRAASG